MVSNKKDNVLAVLSLSGGNDGLNTVIPMNNGLYRDFRPNLGIAEEQIIPLKDPKTGKDTGFGFHPSMAPMIRFLSLIHI